MRKLVTAWFCLALLLAGISSDAATLYVSPTAANGNDKNRFTSLQAALRQLLPGDELIIGAGVYREPLDLRLASKLSGASGSLPTRIHGDGRGKAIIKGSQVVTDWQAVGAGLFIKRGWSVNSQQVFIDGKPLQQIAGTVFNGYPAAPGQPKHPLGGLHNSNGGIWPARIVGGVAEMKPNSFFYDAAQQQLYIKTEVASLQGRTVEVSVLPYLLIGQSVNKLTISGLSFEHANTTSVSQSGAISLQGNAIVLDSLKVSSMDGNGIDLSGDDNIVKNSSTNYCGMVGLKVRGRRAQVLNNEMNYNNTRGFNKWWEAGGAKFVGNGGLQDSEVAGNRALFNQGDGLWFDWHNHDNRIHDNIVAYNKGMGIHYEASSVAVIYDNEIFGNEQRGIYLPNSADSVVAYNLVVANGLDGIAIVNERHVTADKDAELLPKANQVIGNIVGWNGKAALVLPVEALNNVADANVYLSQEPPVYSLGWGDREHPQLKGLAAWQGAAKQDLASYHQAVARPSSLVAALQARALDIDWAVVRQYSKSTAVPARYVNVASIKPTRTAVGPAP